MVRASIKDEAIRLVESLPEDFTWDDLLYVIYVCQATQSGLEASREGRVVSLEVARARFECA